MKRQAGACVGFTTCYAGVRKPAFLSYMCDITIQSLREARPMKIQSCVLSHLPPAKAQATSYTNNASTCSNIYKQHKHGQPVIHAAQAHAITYMTEFL